MTSIPKELLVKPSSNSLHIVDLFDYLINFQDRRANDQLKHSADSSPSARTVPRTILSSPVVCSPDNSTQLRISSSVMEDNLPLLNTGAAPPEAVDHSLLSPKPIEDQSSTLNTQAAPETDNPVGSI